jgi:hypothetical protein
LTSDEHPLLLKAEFTGYQTIDRHNILDPIKGGVMNTSTNGMDFQILMPGLIRYTDGRSTRVTFRWFYGVGGWAARILEILILIFGIIVVVVSYTGVAAIFTGGSNFSLILIDGFFFITGLILVYRGLLLLLNTSTFEWSEDTLSARHGPLPGLGNFNLHRNTITGVEWQKVGQSRGSGYSGTRLTSGYSAMFNVILHTTSGKTLTLVSGIRAREYAFALSSEISNLLK